MLIKVQQGFFVSYSDADWTELPCRRSTSGSALFYINCLIAWKSRKQEIVAISTSEAEMIAIVETFKKHKTIHKIFEGTGHTEKQWIENCDDQACINIAQEIGSSGRVKHIEPRFHAIQGSVQGEEIELVYCVSNENRSDTLMKSLRTQTHRHAVAQLSMKVLWWGEELWISLVAAMLAWHFQPLCTV